MFDEHFPPYCAETVMRWTPTWSKQTDPSGRYVTIFWSNRDDQANAFNRAIEIHNAKYEE
jgi:asparagine synthase (glutamine-hydrolysing)